MPYTYRNTRSSGVPFTESFDAARPDLVANGWVLIADNLDADAVAAVAALNAHRAQNDRQDALVAAAIAAEAEREGAPTAAAIAAQRGVPGGLASLDLGGYVPANELGHVLAAPGVSAAFAAKANLVNGVVPNAELPALNTSKTFPDVASQAAMLALTGVNPGDVALRTDFVPAHSFMFLGGSPSVLSNWSQTAGAGSVVSIAGQSGVLTLADIGAASVTDVEGRMPRIAAVVATSGGDYTGLSAAVTAIGSAAADVHVKTAVALTANLTIPATMRLTVGRGGSIDRAGFTLTIAGGLEAARQTVFTGTGSTVFSAGSAAVVFPEWWGAKAESIDVTPSVDSGPAISAAVAAVKAAGGVVDLLPANYKVLTTIDASLVQANASFHVKPRSVTIQGRGSRRTYITGGEAAYGFIDLVGSNHIQLKGIGFQTTGTLQYGIVTGRTTGDGSSGQHRFDDVLLYGSFTKAAVFAMASEICTYDHLDMYVTAGKGLVLAKDIGDHAVTAKYAPLSTTDPYGGGNGVNRMLNCTLESSSAVATDNLLQIEFAQTLFVQNLYIFSHNLPRPIYVRKICHNITWVGVQQEFLNVEPWGVYYAADGLAAPLSPQFTNQTFIGCRMYGIYGEDGVTLSNVLFRGQFRGTQTYTVDVDNGYDMEIHSSDTTVNTAMGGITLANLKYRVRTAGDHNNWGRAPAGNITVPNASLDMPGSRSDVETLTNKRITPRVVQFANATTISPNFDTTDSTIVTALAGGLTIGVTGTPTSMQQMVLRIKDNGTSQSLTWVSNYRGVAAPLPAATVPGETLHLTFRYNAADAKIDLVSIGKNDIVLRPEDGVFGAKGDGTTDDYAAVKACFDVANSFKDQVGNYAEPGATVLLRGKYSLASLTAPIDVMCNVITEGAIFTTPAAYTGTAVRVGHTTAGQTMQNMSVDLPSVIGATVAGVGSLPAGAIGVLIRNVYSSDIRAAKIVYFETLLRVGGESWGVAYNEIRWRTLSFGKVAVKLKALDATGWANQNTFIAGSVTGSIAWAGRRGSGVRGVVLDGSGSNTITGNTFLGCAFESDHYEHVIEFINSYQNQFYGCRHEQGIAAASAAVSGATITSNAHVLAVDEMVVFTGAAAPTGMSFDQPYYVVAATTNTFQVSASQGGSPITFTSAGTSVAYTRPHRVRFDTSYDNVIDLPMTPVRWIERTYGSGVPAQLAGNIIRYAQRQTLDAYAPPTWPISRLRNRYNNGTTLNVPVEAVYPYNVDPELTPDGWSVGMSERGPVWKSGIGIWEGTGTPEGAVTAPPGSLYLRRDPAAGTSFYKKESGTGNTGWVAAGAAYLAPDVQTFTADGTWTKPAGATLVQVEMFGGGGGGGSGARQATGVLATGGAGGGSAGFMNYTLKAADIPSTAAVVVGQGGVGGAAVTTDTTNGNAGAAGTASVFGSILKAWNGFGGGAGTATGAASGGSAGAASSSGNAGAASSASGGAGSSSSTASSAAPGAAGGGITTGNVAANGGVGGTTWASLAGGTGGAAGVVDTTPPVAGGSVTAGIPLPGGSSGGGASSVTTAAQAGGNGGLYGAGGSGGGASRNGNNSGAGGNGANGVVRVITYF